MAEGTTGRAYSQYREYFSGEILVLSPGFMGASPLGDSESAIVKRTLADSGFNPILKLYPDFAQGGYYTEADKEYRAFTSADIELLESQAQVTGVTPYITIPGTTADDQGIDIRVMPAESTDTLWQISKWSGAGAGLATDFDAVINSYGGPGADLGAILEVNIPYFKIDKMGLPYVDRGLGHKTYRVRVVGKAQFPTRAISWSDSQGNVHTEQGYLHAPEFYLTEDTWQGLWQHHGAGAPYPVVAVSLKVDNLGLLSQKSQELSETLPQWAILSVAKLATRAERYNLLDHFYQAPAHLWQGGVEVNEFAQQNYGTLTALLLFLNAGMLLASQMLASVASRRNEIGILKAIGAKKREVVNMILVEAILIAVLGASVGFSLVKLAAIHKALSNHSPFLSILTTTVVEMGGVLGVTILASLLFGALPAWRVSQLTVMEVFRNE